MIPFTEIGDFLDYALAEAKRTAFDVQTLGGVRQYLAGYQAAKAAKNASKAQETRKAQERQAEAEKDAYEAYRRSQARWIFETLAPEERTAIETAASARAASFAGSLRKIMTDRKRDEIVIDRHGDAVESFEDWRAGR